MYAKQHRSVLVYEKIEIEKEFNARSADTSLDAGS